MLIVLIASAIVFPGGLIATVVFLSRCEEF